MGWAAATIQADAVSLSASDIQLALPREEAGPHPLASTLKESPGTSGVPLPCLRSWPVRVPTATVPAPLREHSVPNHDARAASGTGLQPRFPARLSHTPCRECKSAP